MGFVKKVILSCLFGLSYLAAMPAMAQIGPMCSWPFKPFRFLGPTFAEAFIKFATQNDFNNFYNAGLW